MGKVLPILIFIVILMILGIVIIQKSPFKNLVPRSQVGIEVIYTGSLPCADCPGIDETLTFYTDKTYTDKNAYQERDTFIDTGIWTLKDNIYQLTDSKNQNKKYYLITGNKINPLDPDTMKVISSPLNLSLTKQSN